MRRVRKIKADKDEVADRSTGCESLLKQRLVRQFVAERFD